MFYRAGSLAAFAQALAYLLFLVLVLAVLPAQGGIQVADFLNPASLLAKAVAHPQTVPTIVILDLLNIGFGVFPLLVLFALVQSFPQATIEERVLVVGFVLINTTLYVASAAIDSGGFPAFVQLYQQHAQEAVTGYRVLETVTLQLGNAAAASYGVAVLVATSTAWRTRAVPRPFVWLSLVWGAIAVFSWPFIIIGALGPVVGIVWSVWSGLLLWRVAAPLPKQSLTPVVEETRSQEL
jgi:hypothetical protein